MSLFKKLLGSNQDGDKSLPCQSPPSLQPMNVQLQRKFAKGVQYNMKIVIKGDRNVGKSCLFYRLQGQKFKEEYIPTEEIQVCSIQWNYKATDDVVKVEVWDIVDKGKKRKKQEGLKMDHAVEEPEEPCLDAEFLDVYKGTHGVIMVYDITKQWTYSYMEREIMKIPHHIPVLVLGNHRDMGYHRTVDEDKAKYFCCHIERSDGSAPVRYAESSMKNGFGLKYLHKFFNLPFLVLQRETLLKQLETNQIDMESTLEELNIHEESEEQNYELFSEMLTKKKAQQQQSKPIEKSKLSEEMVAKAEIRPQNLPVPKSVSMPTIPKSEAVIKEPQSVGNTPVQESTPASSSSSQNSEQKTGFFSRLFKKENKPPVSKESVEEPKKPAEMKVVKSVEDFVPDGGLDNSFLDDDGDIRSDAKVKNAQNSDSDEDETGGNPMVAGFQDDFDSDDDYKIPSSTNPVVAAVDLSSSEDELNEIATQKPSSGADDSCQIPVTNYHSDISSDSEPKPVNKTSTSHHVRNDVYRAISTESEKDSGGNSLVMPAVEDLSDSDLDVSTPTVIHDKDLPSEEEAELQVEIVIKQDEDISDGSDIEGVNGKISPDVSRTISKKSEKKKIEEETSAIQMQEGFDDWLDQIEKKNTVIQKAPSIPSSPEPPRSRSKSTMSENSIEQEKVVKKKKKKKKKEKADKGIEEKPEKKHKKKKEKQDKGEKDENVQKKEKKKKKEDSAPLDDMNDLEAFLNDGATSGGAGYESL